MRKKMGLAVLLRGACRPGAAGGGIGGTLAEVAGTVAEKALELDMVWVAVATASWSS